MDDVNGIGKEDETLVVKSKLNQNTLVVESDVISAKDSNKIGEVPDETLVVNSKLNPNTLVVESHVEGAKDSTKLGEVTDEKLVVKSKLNQNTLVVESHVEGAKDSADIEEVTDERLVVKSKLKPNTLVVQSDIVGAKDSTEIGEVADEKGTLYNNFNFFHKCIDVSPITLLIMMVKILHFLRNKVNSSTMLRKSQCTRILSWELLSCRCYGKARKKNQCLFKV